jgi:hypothetical protein
MEMLFDLFNDEIQIINKTFLYLAMCAAPIFLLFYAVESNTTGVSSYSYLMYTSYWGVIISGFITIFYSKFIIATVTCVVLIFIGWFLNILY